MNRSVDSTSIRAWPQIKTRSILALGGLAFAASLVSGGFALGRTTAPTQDASALSRSAAVTQTQFANAADAEDAGRSMVGRSAVVEPMFATAADAEYAARSLVSVPELVRPQPVTQQFGTAADAEFAAESLR